MSNRILVLVDSMSPWDRPCSRLASIASRCIAGGLAAIYTAFRIPAVERLKNELDKDLSRFGVVYERQLDMIAELYERIASVEDAAKRLMAPWRPAGEESEDESRERFVDEFRDLRAFFIRLRLFVPGKVADEVEKLVTKIYETGGEFMQMRDDEDRGITNRPGRGWDELWKEIKDEIPVIREHLEDQFRKLLGTA